MNDTFHWLDVQRIAEELADSEPATEPYSIGFVELREKVEGLEGFAAQPGHPVNERILEEIQRLWAEEREGLTDEDD